MIAMRLHDITSCLVILIPFVVTDSVVNEGLRLKQINFRRCKNPPPVAMFKKTANPSTRSTTLRSTSDPVEYMKTPNFDVIFLSEKNSNQIWRKYADLFQPIDLRNAQRIEVSYENHHNPLTDALRTPLISLNRSEVEAVLATLGRKKHIIVLRPRNCKPHFTRRVIEKRLMYDLKNEILRKLLQPLYEKKPTRKMGSSSAVMDPIVNRILEVLDEGDKKMIDGVRQEFELKPSRDLIKYNPTTVKVNSPEKRYKQPCNEGYVFLLQNQMNSEDSYALNDLLLRVLRVVTESS